MPKGKRTTERTTRKAKHKKNTGVSFEKTVARIQQMMDPETKVTHNERLVDRVGNCRQYDVVIRGRFAGRDVLGVIECRDQKSKMGPDAIEAFAKKTENLNANFRLMVSGRGFTDQSLRLAKHEGIGCLSLLPHDPNQVGFGIGDTWFGRLYKWGKAFLTVYLDDESVVLPEGFDSGQVGETKGTRLVSDESSRVPFSPPLFSAQRGRYALRLRTRGSQTPYLAGLNIDDCRSCPRI